ncbi:Protein-tyrosine phosphatase, low molecular weight [Methanolacinia petrolearia DSM 11571]|uniref:Protein-tyrosine phosphatase, low molecular weight n=1 Tax=Methanolacinia petrolearia (strain DSM 11571 / OCM 486 / SEBR 4847) TaxID=679926 RepID=E1RJK4_METP4|nr:arsenate reductase ArsC [Methanolacinia petrolearia]ADN35651.1 Protein-tyrosine phosphatase, low molecular weight [Methanolacinia petrolearia DSM 11571]
MKKKVLFLCTHNSARSQMAEGYLNSSYGDLYEAFSAGTEVTSVNPYAVRVMDEIGIDISGHRSKKIDEFFGVRMDILVTVCDAAHGACPMFPWTDERIHAGFPDPSGASGSEKEILEVFREVRDVIISFIDEKFG